MNIDGTVNVRVGNKVERRPLACVERYEIYLGEAAVEEYFVSVPVTHDDEMLVHHFGDPFFTVIKDHRGILE